MRFAPIVLLFAIAAIGDAAPARLPYQPEPPAPEIIDLKGTVWSGFNDGVKADWVVVFEPGGVLQYSYRGTTYRNGTWKQEGDRLYYEANQKYCECTCTITGDTIKGDSWNRAGQRWQILLHRTK